MNSSPDQSDLFPGFVPAPQMVFVNDRVSFQTEAKQRVILVHGVAYSHYSLEDRIAEDRKSTRLNSSHGYISYAVFCLKKHSRNVNANNSAALTGRSTPLIIFSVNSEPSMIRHAYRMLT